MPKMRNLPFEMAIIERYQRRESSVEEALFEMYLADVAEAREIRSAGIVETISYYANP